MSGADGVDALVDVENQRRTRQWKDKPAHNLRVEGPKLHNAMSRREAGSSAARQKQFQAPDGVV